MRRARRWTAARNWPNSIASSALFQEYKLAQRIGINSGEALVGNFGSRRRFNYSVMSDAVNLASRLEGANKFYGTTIIASETTVALAGEDFAWRELDAIRVKGRTQALKIYELMALSAGLTSSQQALIANYAGGLAHWRAREFALAATLFWPFGRHRPAGIAVLRAGPGIGPKSPGRGLGPDPDAAGKITPRQPLFTLLPQRVSLDISTRPAKVYRRARRNPRVPTMSSLSDDQPQAI